MLNTAKQQNKQTEIKYLTGHKQQENKTSYCNVTNDDAVAICIQKVLPLRITTNDNGDTSSCSWKSCIYALYSNNYKTYFTCHIPWSISQWYTDVVYFDFLLLISPCCRVL